MDREIKFRGLNVKGDWCFGLLARPTGKTQGAVTPGSWYISNSVGHPYAYEVRPATIGQFTGLLDKNGVEIYEGDLIHWQEDGDTAEYEVRWGRLGAAFYLHSTDGEPDYHGEFGMMSISSMAVIGIIYGKASADELRANPSAKS